MEAYKCDRCGRLYEKQTESRLFIGKCKPKDDTGPRWREQDLCPECKKSFEKWWKFGKEQNNKTF